ncbi:winged helix-turn-helix domain-containing protein [Deinococcus humi]|uniref:HTH HARE-type domain-containing protein n=1 Tax=Deinococcus humi TaxID=662880 RepID=A0A7W8JYW7_9DEIO|nr:winged helix-turn-helix domain-containing protein [Deinococcus humi]MBB5365757.1 hypothetical protein [Deinococcus humi]
MLARPLAPGEIVHHWDGDSTKNEPGNLLVLPSQRCHAHAENHLRCARKGVPSLFPEFFQAVTEDRRGTLFERVLPPAGAGHCSPQTGQDTQEAVFCSRNALTGRFIRPRLSHCHLSGQTMTHTAPTTLAQAAQIVLNQAATPLHVEELTNRVLAQGLWSTSGKTPSASMSRTLYHSIKTLGAASPFMQTAPATFTLRPVQRGDTPVAPTDQVLCSDAAMKHFTALRRQLPLHQALWEMAQVTWPIRVVRMPPDKARPKPLYLLLFVYGHGNEEDLWEFLGDHRERDAVRLSVLLRNLYYSGNRDALSSGTLDGYLKYAMPLVDRINASVPLSTPGSDRA